MVETLNKKVKITIVGTETLVRNPIVFTNKLISGNGKFVMTEFFSEEVSKIPSQYDNIELITLNYFPGTDLMFAYTNGAGRSGGILVLGKFNDGFVL